MQLYNLADEYKTIQEQLEVIDLSEEGSEEMLTAFFDTLEGVSGEFDMKAENVALMLKQLTADSKAIKTEADNLKKRQKSAERKRDRLKQYLFDCLEKIGKRKIESPRVFMFIKDNDESVKVTDENKLIDWAQANNDEILKYKDPEIKKKEVKELLRSGIKIDGAELQRTRSLIVK